MKEWQQTVSYQVFDNSACGTYVILNGWAYILNIEIKFERARSQPTMYYNTRLLVSHATARDLEAWIVRRRLR